MRKTTISLTLACLVTVGACLAVADAPVAAPKAATIVFYVA